MTLCDDCANRCGRSATRWDPPEEWCKHDRWEFDADDEEVIDELREQFGPDAEEEHDLCPCFRDGWEEPYDVIGEDIAVEHMHGIYC